LLNVREIYFYWKYYYSSLQARTENYRKAKLALAGPKDLFSPAEIAALNANGQLPDQAFRELANNRFEPSSYLRHLALKRENGRPHITPGLTTVEEAASWMKKPYKW
jgi:hypothetical protein